MTNGLSAQELTTFLLCPRKYEIEHESELTGDSQRNQDLFRHLLRQAICTGYSDARNDGTDPHDAAVSALDTTWGLYADAADHHSSQQESTEKTRARAAIDAYFEAVGTTHLDRIEQADSIRDEPVVGPDITLTTEIQGQHVEVNVDYIMADDSQIVGVRLTDRMWGSKVPYETDDELLEEHLDQGNYQPEKVGTVIAARIAEAALSQYGSSETGTELMYLSLMEELFETDGECEAVINRRRMGQFLTDSRQIVDDAIAWMGENITDAQFSPEQVFDEQDHWDGTFEQVVENSCRYCSYAAGCQEIIRREVMFDV
jgi:hypothetical protein